MLKSYLNSAVQAHLDFGAAKAHAKALERNADETAIILGREAATYLELPEMLSKEAARRLGETLAWVVSQNN